MLTVDTSVSESLMFIRFAKLTPRFDNDLLVVSTKEIAENYRERQTKDGEFESSLATMVSLLRMCIWEADYMDWLAMVIYRAKYSKFFSEPSKATKLQARYLLQIVSPRSDSKGKTPDLVGQEKEHLNGLFREACARLHRSESAVSEAIQKCFSKKPSKDANEILILEKTEQWGGLRDRILKDTMHLKECIPTEFIPFQAHIREAMGEFARAHPNGLASDWVKDGAGSALVPRQPNENRPSVQAGNKAETRARIYDENKRDMEENKEKIDVKLGGLKGRGNIGWGFGARSSGECW